MCFFSFIWLGHLGKKHILFLKKMNKHIYIFKCVLSRLFVLGTAQKHLGAASKRIMVGETLF